MNAPQITLLVLFALGLGVTTAKHGEPRGKYNIWAFLISAAVELGILFWGGFFS